MKTRKITNLITTSVMASALIFSYGGSAFANEDTTGTALTAETNTEIVSNVTTEGAQEGTTNIEEATTKATATITSDTITVETGEQIEEAPALVPGDFFYFVKTFMEKIRLAVTLDDYKEAQLLAEFATERIAEANALIVQGKTEEAAKLLQEAIATQETASEVLDQTKEEATNDVAQEDAEKVTEEDTNETTATTEDTVEVEESAADEEVVAVESKIGNNIVALLAAVEKIDNPRAQEALMKNIEKSFAKLSKKIQKLEEKNGTEDVTTEEVATEEDTTNENKVEEATVKNSVEGEANTSTEKQEIADVEVEEVEEETTVVAPVKAVKTEKTQKESVQAKVEAKQQQVQAKQQAVKAKVEEKKNQVQAKVEEKKQAVKAKVEQKRNENANKDKE